MFQGKQVTKVDVTGYYKNGVNGTGTADVIGAPVLLINSDTASKSYSLVASDYTVASNKVSMFYVIGGDKAVTSNMVSAITKNWATSKEITE
jgi:hypothetical protein